MDNQENKPTRGTDSQLDADDPALLAIVGRALADRNADACGLNRDDNWQFYSGEFIVDAKVAIDAACRCRAQGGNTSKESGSDVATTTSTVSAPDVQVDIEAVRQIADELELEASNYEGDFADTVNGCADALRHLVDAQIYTEGAQKAPEEVRESATDKAIQRAAGELPDGYEVVIELENGAGGVVWIDEHGERHIIEGEGHISDDINEAIDRALEHAAPDALRTSSTDQANADTGSAA